MASAKGRARSWNNRTMRLFVITKRYEKRQRELKQQERTRRRLDRPYAGQRLEYISRVLDQSRGAECFGVQWVPGVPWARGSSIWPHARIFDEFVGPEWKITVVDDLDESGEPGWLFERISRAA